MDAFLRRRRARGRLCVIKPRRGGGHHTRKDRARVRILIHQLTSGGGFMLEGMHHISISVDDLEEARDFYAGLLELAEIDRPDLPNPGYWFQAGACQLHLTGRQDRASETSVPGTGAGETHFAFAASDLEPVKKRLEIAGVDVKDGVNAELGLRQLFFRDPSDNLVEVFCTLDES
ncbi:MAG: hypothetical protein F4X91_11600 [Nitrospinae bacterium]|nr:hypothetical protein [Nitrospinota bacterium]